MSHCWHCDEILTAEDEEESRQVEYRSQKYCNTCRSCHLQGLIEEHDIAGNLIYLAAFERLCYITQGEIEVPKKLLKKSEHFKMLVKIYQVVSNNPSIGGDSISWRTFCDSYEECIRNIAEDLLGRPMNEKEKVYLRKKCFQLSTWW